MRILHVTPHLGGGVGKAHAFLHSALAGRVEQSFVLLEPPRDRRYADLIAAQGGRVHVARDLDEIGRLAGAADIVQFEFWNHPRLFECLARAPLPPLRSVFWSHVSGLFRPLIPPGLFEAAGRFVFTTAASLAIAPAGAGRPRPAVIDSAFGFATPARERPSGEPPRLAYLGTVDFVKMHPGFFDAIDALELDTRAAVWGACAPPVAARALAMAWPHRVHFRGQTDTPEAALAEADIFFYPLQPDHYGTAENALVEAMSLGLVPVVLNNPAEAAIVRHGDTGLIGDSIDDCVALLRSVLTSPALRRRLSRNAAATMAAARTPQRSADAFVALWDSLRDEAPRRPDFAAAIGDTPADWYAATQRLPGAAWTPACDAAAVAAKGSFAHFAAAFPDDPSLAALRARAA